MLTQKASIELVPRLRHRDMVLHDSIEFIGEKMAKAKSRRKLMKLYDQRLKLEGNRDEIHELLRWLGEF